MQATQEQIEIVKASLAGDNILIEAKAGCSKEQPLTSLVLTPNGYIRMGDIKVGDKVCSPNSTINTVLGIHPQGVKDVYELHFSDGSIAECGLEHLWKIESRNWNKNKGYRVLPLKDFMDTRLKTNSGWVLEVPLTEVEYGNSTKLPLEPYLLGCLLADGSLHKTILLSAHEDDSSIIDTCNSMLPEGTKAGSCRHTSDKGIQQTFVSSVGKSNHSNSIKRIITELGLLHSYSHTKFIPKMYLTASREQRIELLRGLMDCDGSVESRNRIKYATTSTQLRDDIMGLIKSLGGSCTYGIYHDSCRNNPLFVIVVKFNTLNPFRLPRKANKVTVRKQNRLRKAITKIVKTSRAVPQQCISLDGDHLYITDGFTTTHNTSTMLLVMQYNPNKKFLLVTFSSHLAKEGLEDKKKYNLQNSFPMTMHKLAKTHTIDTGSVTILGQSYSVNRYAGIKPWIHGNTLVEAYGKYANPWDLGRELKEFCESTSSTFESNPAMAKLFIGVINMGLMTHDIYMKIFTLGIRDKSILLSKYYDVFVADECLTGDTKVEVEDGRQQTIRCIVNRLNRNEKVMVKSFNTTTDKFEMKRASNPLTSHNRDIVKVHTTGVTKIKCTPNHKILTTRGYVMAGELRKGDLLIKSNSDVQKTSKYLNDDQYQILLGSAFGDGHIALPVSKFKDNPKNAFRLKFTQGEKQLDYLKWKSDAFGIPRKNIQRITSGYTGKDNVFSTCTTSIAVDREITLQTVMEDITALGLAVWMMDDGSMQRGKYFTLSSNNLSKEENEYVVDILLAKFGINAQVANAGRGFYGINFGRAGTQELLAVIGKYIHRDLSYKFGSYAEYVPNAEYRAFGVEVVREVEDFGKATVYDFEVEDNHNFLVGTSASKTVVHNCQDLNPQIGSLAIHNDINQQICCGDRYQAIFEFLLKGYSLFEEPKLRTYTKLSLTRTFRCTQHVCNLALGILRQLGYEGEYTGYDRTGKIETTFYISRTNIQCFFIMLQMADAGMQFDTGVDLKEIRNVLSSFLFITSNKDAIMFANSVKDLRAIANYDKLDSEYKEHCKAYINDMDKQEGIGITKYIEDNTGQSFNTVIEILDIMTKRELGMSELFTYVSNNIVRGHNNLINNPFLLKG